MPEKSKRFLTASNRDMRGKGRKMKLFFIKFAYSNLVRHAALQAMLAFVGGLAFLWDYYGIIAAPSRT